MLVSNGKSWKIGDCALSKPKKEKSFTKAVSIQKGKIVETPSSLGGRKSRTKKRAYKTTTTASAVGPTD